MRKVTMIVVLVFLVAGVASIATIHYMDDERVAQASQPTTKPGYVKLDGGCYMRFIAAGMHTYVGVVFPDSVAIADDVFSPQANFRKAKAYVAQHDKGQWVDVKTVEKEGFRIHIFRKASAIDDQEVKDVLDEIAK